MVKLQVNKTELPRIHTKLMRYPVITHDIEEISLELCILVLYISTVLEIPLP
jgi:hypothetical protein